jgi:hypothetical protein
MFVFSNFFIEEKDLSFVQILISFINPAHQVVSMNAGTQHQSTEEQPVEIEEEEEDSSSSSSSGLDLMLPIFANNSTEAAAEGTAATSANSSTAALKANGDQQQKINGEKVDKQQENSDAQGVLEMDAAPKDVIQLPAEFVELLHRSCLRPIINSHLMNDSGFSSCCIQCGDSIKLQFLTSPNACSSSSPSFR